MTREAVSSPTGVFDIIPMPGTSAWQASALWNYIEKVARDISKTYGFHEIRTPIFEHAEVFYKSVGDATDIVSKEMYLFEDRGGRKLALRPEGTAAVMRALIEHKIFGPVHDLRLFYIGPMFRYERPQAGRFRQHHQFGVEALGVASFEQDAELIQMLCDFYAALSIPNLVVQINSLGSTAARERFRTAFVSYLTPLRDSLSKDSQVRLEKNPLRIFDSKDPEDQRILNDAPQILDFLDDADRVHFEGVLRMLDLLSVSYKVSPKLVRGLDYYQKTVFEVTTDVLGAHNTIGAGGRYDGLLHQMGGPDLPSIGFATGLERVIQTMLAVHAQKEASPPLYPLRDLVDLLIIPMDSASMDSAAKMAQRLRKKGVRVIVDMTKKKLKAAISQASQSEVKSIIVLGENELQSQSAKLKWLSDGREEPIRLDAIDILSEKFISS